MAKPIRVYPVRGVLAVGYPDTELEVETAAEAKRLVATGAFALSAAEAEKASPWGPLPKTDSQEAE